MTTAYLASTDFPRSRSVVETPINLTTPSTTPPQTHETFDTTSSATIGVPSTSTSSSHSSTTAMSVASGTSESTALHSTTSETPTHELNTDQTGVMRLISESLEAIEQAMGNLPRSPTTTVPIADSPSISTSELSSNQSRNPSEAARGQAVARSTPAGIRSPVFRADTPEVTPLNRTFSWDSIPSLPSTPETPIVLAAPEELAPVFGTTSERLSSTSLTQVLNDLYGAPDSGTVLIGETPLAADIYLPEGSDLTDLTSLMEQNPIIIVT